MPTLTPLPTKIKPESPTQDEQLAKRAARGKISLEKTGKIWSYPDVPRGGDLVGPAIKLVATLDLHIKAKRAKPPKLIAKPRRMARARARRSRARHSTRGPPQDGDSDPPRPPNNWTLLSDAASAVLAKLARSRL